LFGLKEGEITMGHEVEAKCLDCGTTFTVMHGGGFFFHLVRCDKCGRTKSIGFDDLGELHLRYLKGSPGPYCIASSEHDEHVRKHLPVEPISEDEYHSRCYRCQTYTIDKTEDPGEHRIEPWMKFRQPKQTSREEIGSVNCVDSVHWVRRILPLIPLRFPTRM
jgi:hypothetical protein